MNLHEDIHRIKEVMGIISEVKSSYTVNQIKKGLNKSANDNDITINTNVDNVIDNIDQFEFQVGSVESFLNDENSFTSEALVDNLITYVKEKGLNVDESGRWAWKEGSDKMDWNYDAEEGYLYYGDEYKDIIKNL